MSRSYEFRQLGPLDAEKIAHLHLQIWRDTYTGLMDQDKLDSLDVQRSTERWRGWLESDDAPDVLGAFVGDDLAGWITVGAPRDDDAPRDAELWVLNTGRAHHGGGLGQQLLDARVPARAYLWVVQGNDRAIAFYRKNGFEFDGAQREGNSGETDLRMVRG